MADLSHDSFPLSSRYDAEWLLSLDMGPNPLWMLEELLEHLVLDAGSRVLDLGCGRGATSVFLAKEFGVTVDAVDLWVPADEIAATLDAAGVASTVTASNADVRDLPFDDDVFDAIISIDAWEYFGTDDRLLPSLLRVLRPGGTIAMATPAMHQDARDLGHIPDHIKSVVGWEALTWHTPHWWQQQWELTDLVTDVRARTAATGWQDWLRWSQASAGDRDDDQVVQMLQADGGDLLTFALLSAQNK